MDKPGLALLAAREARAASPDNPDVAFLFLDLLRQEDMASAISEAESIAASASVPADLLSGCINVLASRAEEVDVVELGSFASRVLAWCERLDRAQDRERARRPLLALADFNRGMVFLRLNRKDEAIEAFKRAESMFPAGLKHLDITSLQVFDHRAREIARQIRRETQPFRPHPAAA
jgi:tetratricopeptide (TPR) repeat protein